MYQGLLYTNNPKAKSIPPQFNYINQMMNKQMDRVQFVHQSISTTVAEKNLLIQIIQSLPFSLSGDPLIDYRKAMGAITQIANAHRLTNDDSKGIIHTGAILPFESKEVILCVSRAMNFKEAEKDWKKLTPLRFISHPVMDNSFPIFSETLPKEYLTKVTSTVKGDRVFAFELDIPCLVYMLSAFATENNKLPFRNFIGQFVMINALKSFTDVSFMNMHFNQAITPEQSIKTWSRNSGYTLALPHSQIATAFKEVGIRIVKQNRDIPTIVEEINLPFTEDPMDYLYAAFYFNGNRQSRWALDVAYMPIIRGLLAIDKSQETQMSLPIKRIMKRGFIQMEEGSFLDGIGGSNADAVIKYIESQLKICVNWC